MKKLILSAVISMIALTFISCETSRSGHLDYTKRKTSDSSVWRCNKIYYDMEADSLGEYSLPCRSMYTELHMLPNGFRTNDTVYIDHNTTVILKERISTN